MKNASLSSSRQKIYTSLLAQPLAYEARPYVALFIGAIGVFHARSHGSLLSLVSGFVLLACGGLVLSWRMSYRRR